MDQTLINWIIAGVGASIGWIMRIIWTEIKLVQKNQREIESNISDNYVRKDDYRVDIAEIKGMLGRIFDRLENKADK
jgi:uncharacterized membrane-anchored protein YhcB (DUF1043 family)